MARGYSTSSVFVLVPAAVAAFLFASMQAPPVGARSYSCAQRAHRGETLKPDGDGRGWSKKYSNIGKCLDRCNAGDGYRYIVESESGSCYCWKEDADYRWSREPGGDKVYDVSRCSTTRGGSGTSSDDSDDCMNDIVRRGKTLKPDGSGRGWSRKYDDLDTCLEECSAADGFKYIVEAESGSCYCWREDADYRWSDDAGGDLVYEISKCSSNRIREGGTSSSSSSSSSAASMSGDGIQLSCPTDDQPGWIDQPRNMRCKEHGRRKFVMKTGYEFLNWDGKWMEYDGSMRECRRICQGLIIGDFTDIPASCWLVDYDEDERECIMYVTCTELERHQGSQVSIYCGLT